MRFLSNFGCKIIFMCSVNFWHQQDSNSSFKGSIGHVTSQCNWPIDSDTLSPSQNGDINFVSMDYPHPNQKTMVQGDGVARGQFLCDPYTCTVCLTLSYNGQCCVHCNRKWAQRIFGWGSYINGLFQKFANFVISNFFLFLKPLLHLRHAKFLVEAKTSIKGTVIEYLSCLQNKII